MPVTKSAKKALKQDRRNAIFNLRIKKRLREVLKTFSQKPTREGLSSAYSVLDHAVNSNVIHKNRAARIKAKLAKKLPEKPARAPSKKSTPAKKRSSRS